MQAAISGRFIPSLSAARGKTLAQGHARITVYDLYMTIMRIAENPNCADKREGSGFYRHGCVLL